MGHEVAAAQGKLPMKASARDAEEFNKHPDPNQAILGVCFQRNSIL